MPTPTFAQWRNLAASPAVNLPAHTVRERILSAWATYVTGGNPDGSNKTGLGPNMLSAAQSSFEDGSTGGWGTGGDGAVANTTDQAYAGTHSLQGTCTQSGSITFTIRDSPGQYPYFPVFPVYTATTYTFTAYTRAATTARNVYWFIYWYTPSGTYINRTNNSPAINSTTGWTLATYTTQPLAGAAFCFLTVYIPCALSEVFYLDNVFMGAA
jgi:hypothetical protein